MVCCWEDGPRTDECGSTCMLDDGHDGPHEWTPDNMIVVRFGDVDEKVIAVHRSDDV